MESLKEITASWKANAEILERERANWRCPRCGGPDWTAEEDGYRDRPGPCLPCREKARTDRLAKRRQDADRLAEETGIPRKYIRAKFGTLSEAVQKTISEWVHGTDFLTFLGPVGCGKTWAAAAAAKEWIILQEKRRPLFWVESPTLIREMRDFETAGETFDRYGGTGLLVLDDLGAERDTEYASEQVLALISRRYDWERPTIVTTNVPPEELMKNHPRLASRILSGKRVCLSGEDRRLNH
jgi:DNA replication protein DnaC